MATQTKTQRQAAAKKAAATRKRNSARQSALGTKASARQTARSARSTTRSASRTAKRAARTSGRRAAAETSRLGSVAEQLERSILIPIGAVLEARDRIGVTVRTYSNRTLTRRKLNRFERRGATALRRNRRGVERQINNAAGDVQKGAEEFVGRVRELV